MQQSFLFLSFVLVLGLGKTAAEDGAITVPSVLKSAMVYRSGAELVHTASAHLEQGNNQLIIGDISNAIDASSIRIRCSGDVTILSVAVSTDYLKQGPAGPVVKKLQDSIGSIEKELGRLDISMKTDKELLDLLSANKTIGSSTGVSVTELSKMMDYYRQKVTELRTELSGYEDKTGQLKQTLDRLEQQVKEEEKKNSKTGGALVLQLLSPMAGPCSFTISYLTVAARWEPSYDLKVENATDPLHLIYKAHLVQTSGIDWKNVKLSLSTAMPALGGNAPVLKTWFLKFAEPALVGYFSNSNAQSNMLAGTVAGVQMKKEQRKDELRDYVSVNDQQMDVVFDIDIPYDVPGNGKEQGVVLKEYQLPCTYQYYAAPRVDKDAYLLGQVLGWEKLNLLPGEASIMVEGTYIGKSVIDAGSLQDTLNLTLGRDKRIIVRKEKVADFSSIKFLGSNKKQVFTYEITVRNNKKEKVDLLLKDQYPISSDKDIEEELLDSGGAVVNKETGILTWKMELAPGESRKYRISYSVKYPKDKIVNITGV